MTAEDYNDRQDAALKRLLSHLSSNIKRVANRSEEEQESADLIAQAAELVESKGGIVVPMSLDVGTLAAPFDEILKDLTSEQAKASMFLGRLDDEHPYRVFFNALSELWTNAAFVGAQKIAEHQQQKHNGNGQIGPREFSAAWMSIAITAVLGALRYGQEHPDAFKGMEGIKEGDISDTISKLIAWADQQVEAMDQQEDPDKE